MLVWRRKRWNLNRSLIIMDMSNVVERKPHLCKGRWVCKANSEGLRINKANTIPQSSIVHYVNYADSSLYTREPKPYMSQLINNIYY